MTLEKNICIMCIILFWLFIHFVILSFYNSWNLARLRLCQSFVPLKRKVVVLLGSIQFHKVQMEQIMQI